jgi:hypothetical protein
VIQLYLPADLHTFPWAISEPVSTSAFAAACQGESTARCGGAGSLSNQLSVKTCAQCNRET